MITSEEPEGEFIVNENYQPKDDLTKSFEAVLKDLPEVLHYIRRLNDHIRKQQTTILKLFAKLKDFKSKSFYTATASTQTDDEIPHYYWNGSSYDTASSQAAAWCGVAADGVTPTSQVPVWSGVPAEGTTPTLADEVKQVAESAMQQTGFVYEASSGLYYDYNTGYYYNAELGLYYDGTSGTYFYYNEDSQQFEYHSQATFPDPEEAAQTDDQQMGSGSVPETNNQALPIISLKPPPPPLPPKSPPVSTDSSEKKTDRKRSSKEDTSERKVKESKRRREASPVKGGESPEDGEITDSNEGSEPIEKSRPPPLPEEEIEEEVDEKDRDSPPPTPPGETSSRSSNNTISELVNAWPPCIRIIVQKTALQNLKVGALFIVTCDGGTLGRETEHSVCIPDINISKHHARFTFDNNDGKYYITDMGSRNGTLLDGHRLSSAKQESDPIELKHGSKLQLGSTVLLCHVHGGNETCCDCEPGIVGAANASTDNGTDSSATVPLETKGVQHKQELRRLRKKFGLTSAEAAAEAAGSVCPPGYEDRAQNRRQTVGSHDHNVKTETASIEEPIKASNKGFKMLSKMGWVHGQSLGKDGQGGTTEPILVSQRPEKSGLGVDLDTLPPEVDNRTKRKAEVWKKVQQRYSELPDDTPNPEE